MNLRRQRGFTLIELMVALVVSSLLVGMILAIFSRMSLAYRGQQQIAGVQQVLAAARATIELDAKQAGLAMPQGFKFAGDPPLLGGPPPVRLPVRVVNSNTGPDQVAFFYADTTTQAAVVAAPVNWSAAATVVVDSTAGFLPGDLVVLSTATAVQTSPFAGEAEIATFDACVMQIAAGGVVGVAGGSLTFSRSPPWGRGDSSHCTTPTQMATMVYKFVARAYQIDTSPARIAFGMLQQSLNGGLLGVADTWTDLAFGFTDLQTAVRIYSAAGLDVDGDGVASSNWYSGASQDNLAALGTPIEISISLVARTDRDVEGISTSATPQLLVPAYSSNNPLGDRASITLAGNADPALQGSRIYRFTTFQVDFRNLGVGR